ncbi:MAG: UTP--glucose-1-phosphate uridylyltransferase [Betaproteobacteria bacterium]|nr:UTP--glucose-1-phosphate uridylyltransferase [Betaproteobacteria bacterium]
MNTVRKAVFPVAGLGTRFLPATKASPKEMLCVVDKPLIQYAVEEAIEAGITEMIFVTGRSKRSIEDHFDKSFELEHELEAKKKTDLLQLVRSIKPSHVNCVYVRQPEALGLGHAVNCAAQLVGNEPFAVILADDLLDNRPGVLKQMVDLYKHYRSSIVAVEKILPEQSQAYGVVAGTSAGDKLTKMSKIVEKPAPKDAPSDQGVVGRYIFTPSIFQHITNLKPGAGGEYQLTDAIEVLLNHEAVYAYAYEGIRYDCGSKIGFLKATVELALRHPETKDEFKKYLASMNHTSGT